MADRGPQQRGCGEPFRAQMIVSNDWNSVENGLTVLESAALVYGEQDPNGLLTIVVGVEGTCERSRRCST